jgi:hypothetical protein
MSRFREGEAGEAPAELENQLALPAQQELVISASLSAEVKPTSRERRSLVRSKMKGGCNVVRSEKRRSKVKDHRLGCLILLCPLVLTMDLTVREGWGQWEEPTVGPVVPPKVPEALNLHREAIVIDGHVHLVNSVFHQGIDPWTAQKTGTFDYARAKAGGLDTKALVARGYSADTVRRILGENWLRVLSAAKVPPQSRPGRTDELPQRPQGEAR